MNIQKMMQQAQAMQQKVAEMQERMGETQVSGTAGNGLVTVVMTCKGRVDDVKISQHAIDPADPTMLEDLVKAAMNDAHNKGVEAMAGESEKMMKGMGLPAGIKLPF